MALKQFCKRFRRCCNKTFAKYLSKSSVCFTCNGGLCLYRCRAVACVQMIAGLALMMQCHLITEENNKTFNSDCEVFQWLASVLNCSVAGKLYRGLEFPVIEVVEVLLFGGNTPISYHFFVAWFVVCLSSVTAVFKLGSADQRGSVMGSQGVSKRIPKSSHCLHGF